MLKRMTCLALIAATSVVFAVSATAQETAKIKFTKKALPKGMVCTLADTESQQMTNVVNMGGQTQSTKGTEEGRTVKIATVKQVSDKGVTKAMVEFKVQENKKTLTGPMGEQSESDDFPLAGKSFVVAIGAEGLEAKTAAGEAPSAKEMEALKKEFGKEAKSGSLLDPHMKLEKTLVGKELAVGDTVKLDETSANDLFEQDEDGAPELMNITLTLKGTKTHFGTKCAVFEVKMKFDEEKMAAEMQFPGMQVKFDITGELVVGIENTWVYAMSFGGPVTFDGSMSTPEGDVSLDIDMTMKMSGLATYQMPTK